MPSRTRPTSACTGFWRWLVPSRVGAAAASASTASWRTLDGPEPKRPSAGSRSAGMRMSGIVVLMCGRDYAIRRVTIPRYPPASARSSTSS